jgi:beta-aspartyl-peptidase (threonine type)
VRTGTIRWSIILHGGARDIEPEADAANRAGCRRALTAGEAVLRRGGSALEAVEAAIRALEENPTFNAGYGSVLNADGEVEMDAAVMDGATLDVGAVAALRGVRHPVSVARMMLREEPVLLAADGARRFAAARGAELCDPRDLLQQPASASREHDTVGCVALDDQGNPGAGTSTGGLTGFYPGRIGDSPLRGCGFYAENGRGAVAFSGDGERIARVTLAAHAMQCLAHGDPQGAAEATIQRLGRVGGEAGCILLDGESRPGWAHNSSGFAVAYSTSDKDQPCVFLRRIEIEDNEPDA